jgi:O-antigen ligase
MPLLNLAKNLKGHLDPAGILVQVFLILAAVVAVFAGGDVLPFPFFVVEIIICLAFLAFCFSLYKEGNPAIIFPKSAIFFLCFILIAFIQCLPLPLALVNFISPKTVMLYENFLPDFSNRPFITISIYPHATYVEIIKMTNFFILFFVTSNIIKNKKQVKGAIFFIITIAIVATFYGLLKKYLGGPDISYYFGVFANRNYYAGFILLVTPLCLGCAFSQRALHAKLVLFFLAAILSVSIVLSLARAAMLGLVLTLLFIGAFLIKERLRLKHEIAIMVLFLIVCAGFLYIVNTRAVSDKFGKLSRSFTSRKIIYEEAALMVKDYPLLGVGLGNYGSITGMYRRQPISGIDPYLHNDHLQLLVEGGLMGAGLFWLFILLICKDIFKQIMIRRNPFVRLILVSGLSSFFGLAVHAVFEMLFPVLTISFMFWFILAIIYKTGYIDSGVNLISNK